MLDEAELFEKIESKQFEIDYDNSITKSIQEYYKANGQIEALEWGIQKFELVRKNS